ncbi:MAG: hypothetical protein IID39_07945 [Planctomycetes bacterium]|nr:hypothetical protein [Planctomycetota bacterium]
MAELHETGIRRVVFADLGKNVYAFYRAAADACLAVLAIADDRFASVARRYRGIPLIRTTDIPSLQPDAIVVSNTSPAHATPTRDRLLEADIAPVHCWFDVASVTREAPHLSAGKSTVVKPIDFKTGGSPRSARVELARNT